MDLTLMTACHDLPTVAEAMRYSAADFPGKALHLHELRTVVAKIPPR